MDNPLFRSYALHSPTGEPGLYNHVIDALLAPRDGDVWQHETAHRISTAFDYPGSGFWVTRELAGMSHVLIWAIAQFAAQHRVEILGETLADLYVNDNSPAPENVRSVLEILIRRLWHVEDMYRRGWYTLAPLAEFAAIDFAEGTKPVGRWSVLEPVRADWNLKRRHDLTVDERMQLDNVKAQMIEEVAAQYPPNFGGYHLRFGSFQNTMRKAWEVYNTIPRDETRVLLLRLCMVCLLLTDRGDIKARDSITTLLANAPTAREDPIGAEEAFADASRELEARGQELVELTYSQILGDLPKEWQDIRRLVQAISSLMKYQRRVGQREVYESQNGF